MEDDSFLKTPPITTETILINGQINTGDSGLLSFDLVPVKEACIPWGMGARLFYTNYGPWSWRGLRVLPTDFGPGLERGSVFGVMGSEGPFGLLFPSRRVTDCQLCHLMYRVLLSERDVTSRHSAGIQMNICHRPRQQQKCPLHFSETFHVRISPQITACTVLQSNTFAQIQCHRTSSKTRKNLCRPSALELSNLCNGLPHKLPAATQILRQLHTSHKHHATKNEPRPSEEEVGTLTKIIEAMGFTGPLKYNKWKIKIAALRMYTCCVERIDYDDFFEKCNLPDTLNSWFLVTQLHVWMCLVRLKQEGRTGKYMCRYIVHSMWEDVQQRGLVMGIDSISLKKSMKIWVEIFHASILGYDEGIISHDKVLAASLWRNIFNQQCDDPRQLELMVEYVRKQIQYLDSLNGDDLLLTGDVVWRPLVETDPQSILKTSAPTYNDEGL
ncbi:ubiquinol-cytochrome c reductase complex assembly factor 1 [Pelodytes ibericus]